MRRTAGLLIRMVRWRVALALIIFMLVGVAWHGVLTLNMDLLLALAGLAASYACATSVNDLVDFEIDKINLPKDADRPLVAGKAQKQDLVLTALAASLIALTAGALISLTAMLLFAASITVNLAYSVPPIQISHRPLLTPLILPIGYVLIPFAIGAAVAGSHLSSADTLICAAFYCLFLGRIILKDFRDRKGDATFGKRTFILTYGKQATLLVSLFAVVVGYGLLINALLQRVGLVSLVLLIFFISNVVMLARVSSASKSHEEQLAIGVGAKMGNGMLVTVLGLLVLQSQSATPDALFGLALFFAAIYVVNFVMFLKRPDESVIAYKAST